MAFGPRWRNNWEGSPLTLPFSLSLLAHTQHENVKNISNPFCLTKKKVNREEHLVSWRFTGTWWPDLCGQSVSASRSLPQSTSPFPHFAFKNALLRAFRGVCIGLGRKSSISLHSPAISLSLLWTLVFWYYLASLYVGYMNLSSLTSLNSGLPQGRDHFIVSHLLTQGLAL